MGAAIKPRLIGAEPASDSLAARARISASTANGITVLRLPRVDPLDVEAAPEDNGAPALAEASPLAAEPASVTPVTIDTPVREAPAAREDAPPPAPRAPRKPRSVRPARRKAPAVATAARAAQKILAERPTPDVTPQAPVDPVEVVDAAESPTPAAEVAHALPMAYPIPSRVVTVAPTQARATSDLRRGVVAGLIVAVALVVLAVMMRPNVSSDVATSASTATALGSAPAPDPAQTAATTATPTAEIAVRLRLGPDATDAYRDSLRATVDAAGYAGVEVRSMPYPVDRPRVQFYDPADRSAAEALARALAPLTGDLVEMRDLSPIAKPDEAGSIDAWLAAAPAKP